LADSASNSDSRRLQLTILKDTARSPELLESYTTVFPLTGLHADLCVL